MITVVLSTGMTTETTFPDMKSCIKHKGELKSQTGLESHCFYKEIKEKNEMDFLVERIVTNLMVLVDAKLTPLFNFRTIFII